MSVIKHLTLSQSHLLDMNRAEIVSNPDRSILDKCNRIQGKLRKVEKDCTDDVASLSEQEKNKCRSLLKYLEQS